MIARGRDARQTVNDKRPRTLSLLFNTISNRAAGTNRILHFFLTISTETNNAVGRQQ